MTEREGAVESPQRQFEELYREVFAFRSRLELEPGNHVFENPYLEYTRIEIAPNAYDDMRITFHGLPREVGKDAEGRAYSLKTVSEISRAADGSLRYFAMDLLLFQSAHSGNVFDAELNDVNETFASADEASPAAQKLIADAREILPTLTMEQYNEDESEWGPLGDRYDRKLQRELTKLDEAMSTAGGALGILQLAALDRHAQDGGETRDFIVDNPERKSSGVVTVSHDSLVNPYNPADWEPEIIALKVTALGSEFRGISTKFTHFITHSLFSYDGVVTYEATDSLESELQNIEIDNGRLDLSPEEALPENVKDIAKKMLDLIVNPLPEYLRDAK